MEEIDKRINLLNNQIQSIIRLKTEEIDNNILNLIKRNGLK
jgi:hypothetical protein